MCNVCSGQWKLNNGGSDFNANQGWAANTSLTFTYTYDDDNSSDTYSFGSGSGNNHNATNDISTIAGFQIFSNSHGSGNNFGFNNISVVSKYTID